MEKSTRDELRTIEDMSRSASAKKSPFDKDKAGWIVRESRMAFVGVLGYLANQYRDARRR